jgi:hypothetical protein
MRRVADAQKPWLVPKRQPVDRDGQELDVIEAFKFVNAIGEERSQRLVEFPVESGERDRWMEASSMRFALLRGML